MNAVEIKNIEFRYPQKHKQSFCLTIDEIKIEAGEFLSIIGPNGCGKSTMLKLIANILKPSEGEILILGKTTEDIGLESFSKYVAYVPQMNYSIFPFSVYETVMMGRTHRKNLLGFEKEEDRSAVNDALKKLEIEKLAEKGINELSGGEAQRVFIARALVQNAEIILLDEPNSHLDIEHQISIFNLLNEINGREGKTIVTISHDLNLVASFTQNVLIMLEGKVVCKGSREEILTQQNIKKYFNVTAEIFNNADNTQNVLIKAKP